MKLKTIARTVHFDKTQWRRLLSVARKRGLSGSALLRLLVQRFLEIEDETQAWKDMP